MRGSCGKLFDNVSAVQAVCKTDGNAYAVGLVILNQPTAMPMTHPILMTAAMISFKFVIEKLAVSHNSRIVADYDALQRMLAATIRKFRIV